MYTADNICKMIEFLIDNIFVQFGVRLFRQVIEIPMETNCAPLLADLFLFSYENEFLDNMIRSGHRRLVLYCNTSEAINDNQYEHCFWTLYGGGDNMYTADNICQMIEFLIDNIFVQFGVRFSVR